MSYSKIRATFLLLATLLYIVLINDVSCAAWMPPIGIPHPPWPADLDIARPALPDPWTSDQAGWYFISPSGCSDTRTYGNLTAPRCSLPASPAAGSKIVLHGTFANSRTIAWNAEALSPIWIMGYDPDDRPVMTNYWTITGSYIILDNLTWNYNAGDGVRLAGNHLMVRDCAYANPFDISNGAGFGISGTFIVFYRNVVSQMGDWQYTGEGDIDRHAIKVTNPAADVWIVDSLFYHCHGDATQVGDARSRNAPEEINRIYIGRNISYENYQTGFWTKNATDVIFSQNLVYNMKTASEFSRGTALGGQYDARHIWFIANTVRDCNVGIYIVGPEQNNGGPWYAIGNLIYNIEFPGPDGACNNSDIGALGYRNMGGYSAMFNTVYNVDMFVAIPDGAGGTLNVSNNIFSLKNIEHNNCTALDVDPSFIHDYNLFSDASYNTESETHLQIEPASNTFLNPGTNFQLKSTSSAVGSANPVEESIFAAFQSRYGIDIRKDILGVSRPQNTWDIGAFEYNPSGGDTTPPAAPTGLTVH